MEEAKEWYDEECMLGIDEAGRGPVLDSKTLSELKREELSVRLKSEPLCGWFVDIILPQQLSASMLQRNKYNLNFISQDSACKLIRTVMDEKKVNLKQVYVDTVGDPVKYEAWLGEKFPNLKFTVRKKADSLFAVVSAASIVAKVTRDNYLKNWTFEEAVPLPRAFGSGYPGDPMTKEWLEKSFDSVFGFPSLARFSWSTCTLLLKKKGVNVLWGMDEEESNSSSSSSSSLSNKRKAESKLKSEERFSFFKSRSIHRVNRF